MYQVGDKAGRLTILEIQPSTSYNGKGATYLCRCDCGNELWIYGSYVERSVRSCGRDCHLRVSKRQDQSQRRQELDSYQHSDCGTRLYRIWHGMKQRCSNPNRRIYEYYGGRGITYSQEWEHYAPFGRWAKANGYSDDLELDRIDNDGPYSPDNCRWVSHSTNLLKRRKFTWAEDKLMPCDCGMQGGKHDSTCPVYRREARRLYKARKKEREMRDLIKPFRNMIHLM